MEHNDVYMYCLKSLSKLERKRVQDSTPQGTGHEFERWQGLNSILHSSLSSAPASDFHDSSPFRICPGLCFSPKSLMSTVSAFLISLTSVEKKTNSTSN